MSNTVDALKNLYKTLTGQDYSGDPNPTDAEVIDKIAKDATGGGGGEGDEGSAVRLIDTTVLDPVAGETNTWQYETGLGVRDFAGASIYIQQDSEGPSALFCIVTVFDVPGMTMIVAINGISGTLTGMGFIYDPETGYISWPTTTH